MDNPPIIPSQRSSLWTELYGVNFKMKPLQQYFHIYGTIYY